MNADLAADMDRHMVDRLAKYDSFLGLPAAITNTPYVVEMDPGVFIRLDDEGEPEATFDIFNATRFARTVRADLFVNALGVRGRLVLMTEAVARLRERTQDTLDSFRAMLADNG